MKIWNQIVKIKLALEINQTMNTKDTLWFGYNLITTLYEKNFPIKILCTFRILSQEIGRKSKKIGGDLLPGHLLLEGVILTLTSNK